jgi:hypothetical protein
VGLLEQVARANPGGSLVVVGKVRADVLAPAPGRQRAPAGAAAVRRAPRVRPAFDVALLPFRVNELTLNANPLKVREYLAAGLPVVATAIPEVEQLGQCLIARDAPEFLAQVRRALKVPGRGGRGRSASGPRAGRRLEEIRGHVAALEARRAR